MSPARPLCALSALADPSSRGFSLPSPRGPIELFLVRRGTLVRAYRNRCPHTGATLEWQPHVFLDPDGELIQCGLHGALFRIETGECVHGPCLGQYLQGLAIGIRGGQVLLLEAPPVD